jgi:hypothetical protein
MSLGFKQVLHIAQLAVTTAAVCASTVAAPLGNDAVLLQQRCMLGWAQHEGQAQPLTF